MAEEKKVIEMETEETKAEQETVAPKQEETPKVEKKAFEIPKWLKNVGKGFTYAMAAFGTLVAAFWAADGISSRRKNYTSLPTTRSDDSIETIATEDGIEIHHF